MPVHVHVELVLPVNLYDVLQVDLFSTPRRRLLIEFTVSTSRSKTVNGITYVDPWYGYTVQPAVQVRVCTCCITYYAEIIRKNFLIDWLIDLSWV